MSRQYLLYGMLALWAVVLFALLIKGVRAGNTVLPVVCVLLASPLLLAFLATSPAIEGRELGDLVSLRTGAWSFLLGDTFVLTAAVAFAAHAWRVMPRGTWYDSWGWTVSCALIGLLAGASFHRWDGGNYLREGAGNRLLSPTKLAHDFVAYPVLFGVLVCVGVPLLLNWSWHTWAFLGCICGWLVLVVCDGLRAPSPFLLHPGWDPETFSVISSSVRLRPSE